MPDNIAIPAFVGLTVGIAFIMIFSLFPSSVILLPPQTDYDEPGGITVTRVPPQFQPWLPPANGVPHLWITEIAVDPDTRNKVTYDNAIWLHRAMDSRGNLAETDGMIDIGQEITTGTVIRLDEAEKEAYFDFYKQTRTNISLIQVTFPNGLVKYYDVKFLEVS
ncbi:MAG TPA: hypothetical protein VF172_03280 [Nitrososphaera sp.]